MKIYRRVCVLVAACCVLVVGGGAAVLEDEPAYVRIVHLSPDSPPFDFCHNGKPFQNNMFYRHATNYRPVTAGEDSAFTRSFAGHRCMEDLILNKATFPGAALRPGSYTSAIAIGSFFKGFPSSSKVGPPALVTPDGPPAPAGKTNLRFINVAINGATRVDFFVNGKLMAKRVKALTRNTVLLAPGSDQIPYHTVSTGRTRLRVKDSLTGRILAQTTLNAKGGRSHSVILIGNADGDPGLKVFLLRDSR